MTAERTRCVTIIDAHMRNVQCSKTRKILQALIDRILSGG